MTARSRGQWQRTLYSVTPNTMAKPVTKAPRGREQRHVNGYTLERLREQAKWPTGVPILLPLEFCIFAKRLFYERTHIINQANAALRQSVGLPGRFITVRKNRTGHTNIPNYCNSAAHACQGFIILYYRAKTYLAHVQDI